MTTTARWTAPEPSVLAIVHDGAQIAAVRGDDLIDALMIVADQLDVKDDEQAQGYSIDTMEDALEKRERLLVVLHAVNGAF